MLPRSKASALFYALRVKIKGGDTAALVRLCKQLRREIVRWGTVLQRAPSSHEAAVTSFCSYITRCFGLIFVHAAKAATGCPKSALGCRLEGLRVFGVSPIVTREELCTRGIAASNAFERRQSHPRGASADQALLEFNVAVTQLLFSVDNWAGNAKSPPPPPPPPPPPAATAMTTAMMVTEPKIKSTRHCVAQVGMKIVNVRAHAPGLVWKLALRRWELAWLSHFASVVRRTGDPAAGRQLLMARGGLACEKMRRSFGNAESALSIDKSPTLTTSLLGMVADSRRRMRICQAVLQVHMARLWIAEAPDSTFFAAGGVRSPPCLDCHKDAAAQMASTCLAGAVGFCLVYADRVNVNETTTAPAMDLASRAWAALVVAWRHVVGSRFVGALPIYNQRTCMNSEFMTKLVGVFERVAALARLPHRATLNVLYEAASVAYNAGARLYNASISRVGGSSCCCSDGCQNDAAFGWRRIRQARGALEAACRLYAHLAKVVLVDDNAEHVVIPSASLTAASWRLAWANRATATAPSVPYYVRLRVLAEVRQRCGARVTAVAALRQAVGLLLYSANHGNKMAVVRIVERQMKTIVQRLALWLSQSTAAYHSCVAPLGLEDHLAAENEGDQNREIGIFFPSKSSARRRRVARLEIVRCELRMLLCASYPVETMFFIGSVVLHAQLALTNAWAGLLRHDAQCNGHHITSHVAVGDCETAVFTALQRWERCFYRRWGFAALAACSLDIVSHCIILGEIAALIFLLTRVSYASGRDGSNCGSPWFRALELRSQFTVIMMDAVGHIDCRTAIVPSGTRGNAWPMVELTTALAWAGELCLHCGTVASALHYCSRASCTLSVTYQSRIHVFRKNVTCCSKVINAWCAASVAATLSGILCDFDGCYFGVSSSPVVAKTTCAARADSAFGRVYLDSVQLLECASGIFVGCTHRGVISGGASKHCTYGNPPMANHPPEVMHIAGYWASVAAMLYWKAPQLSLFSLLTALTASENAMKIHSRIVKGRITGVTKWHAANDFIFTLFQVTLPLTFVFRIVL